MYERRWWNGVCNTVRPLAAAQPRQEGASADEQSEDIMKTSHVILGSTLTVAMVLGSSAQARAQNLDSVQLAISQAVGSDNSINVVPFEFDPNNTNLAKATWLSGTGCAASGGSDPLCSPGGDPKDKKNEGLLFAKTGLTANLVAAGARINGVKGAVLTELGYDLRKPL